MRSNTSRHPRPPGSGWLHGKSSAGDHTYPRQWWTSRTCPGVRVGRVCRLGQARLSSSMQPGQAIGRSRDSQPRLQQHDLPACGEFPSWRHRAGKTRGCNVINTQESARIEIDSQPLRDVCILLMEWNPSNEIPVARFCRTTGCLREDIVSLGPVLPNGAAIAASRIEVEAHVASSSALSVLISGLQGYCKVYLRKQTHLGKRILGFKQHQRRWGSFAVLLLGYRRILRWLWVVSKTGEREWDWGRL